MSEFLLYLTIGVSHIADLSAYDHLVFILALTAAYKPGAWKQLLVLITAFTIGHSLTLLLATFKLVILPSELIEFLIPVTIALTCLYNIITVKKSESQSSQNKTYIHINYVLALIFGLIHGLGFSGYLQHLLGKESSIIIPLLSFNVGIEIGQILIIAVIFSVYTFLRMLFKVSHRDWNLVTSGIAAGVSIVLLTETAFW